MIFVVPSPPQLLHAASVTSDSITITWLPPAEPNGKLNYYVIKYMAINLSGDSFMKRDYCHDSMF